jgi:hypothetical protein
MPDVENKWPKQSDCLRLFGNPTSAGWSSQHLVPVAIPFQMHMDEVPVHSISINKIAAASLSRVLTTIWNACDHQQTNVGKCGCEVFSGSFAVRPIRGGKAMSMHSFGLAIDIDAPRNGLAEPASRTFFQSDSVVVRAFKSERWTWGGDWRGRRDAMHFQAAIVG